MGIPSLAAMIAFGPFETIMALTGCRAYRSMSFMLMPWLARLTITFTMSPRPTSRATLQELGGVAERADLRRHHQEDLAEQASMAMVRSS